MLPGQSTFLRSCLLFLGRKIHHPFNAPQKLSMIPFFCIFDRRFASWKFKIKFADYVPLYKYSWQVISSFYSIFISCKRKRMSVIFGISSLDTVLNSLLDSTNEIELLSPVEVGRILFLEVRIIYSGICEQLVRKVQ